MDAAALERTSRAGWLTRYLVLDLTYLHGQITNLGTCTY